MQAQTIEVLALSIAEMNGAFDPTSEAFAYRNPGKIRVNGNLRNYSTWSGGLKSLISELSRYSDSDVALSVLRNYGCNTFEKEFVVLDYLTRAFGREISAGAVLGDLDVEVR